MTSTDKNDPCPCGSTKKYKHCCQRKEKTQVNKANPNAAMVPTWLQLGMQHLRSERLQQAKVLYEQVLQVNPRQAEALQWLGVIFHKQGNSDRAIELISQAIAEAPSNAFAHSTLGNVLKDVDQKASAIASYRKALSIKPDFAEAHNNLGIVLSTQGKLDEAIESYKKAISLIPGYAEALNNLGTALQAQGSTAEATDAFAKAIALNPNYGQALFNMGNVLHERTPEQAIPFIQKAVTVQQDFWEAWLTLGKLLHAQGDLEQASSCYQRCIAIKPSPGIGILNALALPPIMGDQAEVMANRLRFENNLTALMAEGVKMQDPLKELCNTNFHLAYHGQNDKDIQMKVARFYAQAAPSLLYVAPHCSRPKPVGQKKRIGFLSKFIARHSVALSFSRIVETLAMDGEFEITLISSSDPLQASIQETYPNFAGKYVRLTMDLEAAREEIAALQLDVLVYLDIGMEAFSYFLAFARLARTQCVVGGHPVTTGISTIDYFISADLAETPDADQHYSEKLVRLPFGMFYFVRPALPVTFKSREQLGLPENGHVYLCPMTLHKLHPDFDDAMARILLLDPSGHVILIADKKFSAWQQIIERRFDKTVPQSVRSRIKFLPWVTDPLDFISLNKAADVVLDSFHFGMGTTAIVTCSVGTPYVTKPSEFMRGRVGLFYAKIMDTMECVAQSCEEYAQKAVAIASDKELRQRIQSKILANNHVLFENKLAITDTVEFLRGI